MIAGVVELDPLVMKVGDAVAVPVDGARRGRSSLSTMAPSAGVGQGVGVRVGVGDEVGVTVRVGVGVGVGARLGWPDWGIGLGPLAAAVDGARPGRIAVAAVVGELIDDVVLAAKQAHGVAVVVEGEAGVAAEEEEKAEVGMKASEGGHMGCCRPRRRRVPTAQVEGEGLGIEQLDVFVVDVGHAVAVEVALSGCGEDFVEGDEARRRRGGDGGGRWRGGGGG